MMEISPNVSAGDAPLLAPQQQQIHGTPVGAQSPEPLQDVQVTGVPCLARIMGMCPLCWPAMCYTVEPNQHTAIITLGNLVGMRTEPGCYCDWPHTRQTVSVKVKSINLPESKVTDMNGSPVLVSAILNYRVVDGKKALFAVEDHYRFVDVNATAVLKQVVSTHAYEELKSNSADVNINLTRTLRTAVAAAGIYVESMFMNELNYAPEIAGPMLKKQQAGALVEARELIVEGAVKIAQGAIDRLQESGKIQMSAQDKVKIVTNLLTVACAESDATPTVNVG